MRCLITFIFLLFALVGDCQETNFLLSTQMTEEKSGVYNKNDDIQKVFEVVNFADNKSHGTGFLFKGGFILTNWHVVKNAEPEQIKLKTSDGFEKGIKSVMVDSAKDLAILVPYIQLKGGFEFESEDSILLGKQVYSWGFPFQYGSAILTVGYIAGYRVYVPDPSNPQNSVRHILFNGAFNPGNSGGPILDLEGKIVGIVESKALPLSDEALAAIKGLESNRSGYSYESTDRNGNKETISEAQVIALILKSYQNIAQVMIGEGITIDEIKSFLHTKQISGY